MKNIFFTIIIFLSFTYSSLSNDNKDSIIIINSSKSEYLESEPIWIEVNVNIPTDKKLDMAPSMGNWGILTNGKGDTLPYMSSFPFSVAIPDYRNHYYYVFPLQFYGVFEDSSSIFPDSHYKLLPDTYHFQMAVGLSINKKWEVHYSNIISFTVKAPESDEVEARKRLFELIKMQYGCGGDTIQCNFIFHKILEFKNKYPDSRYLQRAEHFINLLMNDIPGLKDTLELYLFHNIELNPDSYYNNSNIHILAYIYKGSDKLFNKKLINLKKKINSTQFDKFVNEYIEEYEFKKQVEKMHKKNK